MSDWECGMMCGDFEDARFVAECMYCGSYLFVGDEAVLHEGNCYCDLECFLDDMGVDKRELTDEDCE
jgi:hypothetical protein